MFILRLLKYGETMKKNPLFLLIALWLTAVFLPGCASSEQDSINRGVRYLALTGRTFIYFFQDNLSSCDKFLEVYNQISEEVEDCNNPGEGTFKLTKLNAQCVPGAPINAIADFQLEQNNCQDSNTDVFAAGPLSLSLEFSAKGNFAILETDSIDLNEAEFVLSNFRIEIEFSNNDLSCIDSEDIMVEGETCDVASDCRSCN